MYTHDRFAVMDQQKGEKMKNKEKMLGKGISLAALATVALLVGASTGWAVDAPLLGSATSFVMLGGAGVTCTNSTITGVAGSLLTVVPTTTCNIVGSLDQGDAAAIQAFSDAALAYAQVAAIPCP